MALVVENICRYAFKGRYLDRPFVNIWDAQIDTTGTTVSRDEAIHSYAGVLINAYGDELMGTSNQLHFDEVSWVDLNSSNGSTGARTETDKYTLPLTGGNTGAPSPGNVAVLVIKNTTRERGSRNGRWYQPGIVEAGTEGNELGSATVSSWQDTFEDFLFATAVDSGIIGIDYSGRGVVVHTTGANPTTGTWTPIETMTVQARLATQRRRLRN